MPHGIVYRIINAAQKKYGKKYFQMKEDALLKV